MKLLIQLSFVALLVLACGQKENARFSPALEDQSIPVKVSAVTEKVLTTTVVATGMVASQSEIKLAFKTGGVINRLSVKEGDFVRKGQVLATLDFSEIAAQVAQARLAMEKSSRDLKRVENLYQDSVATLEQLQNATTQQKVNEANLEIAEFNKQYSAIVAPVSGRVLRKLSETGELIGPGSPVLVIASTESDWVVKVGLTDREVVQAAIGDAAKVRMDAHPGIVFDAQISQIAQVANPMTGLYEAELVIESGNYRMVSGLVAKAEITLGNDRPAPFVPIGAIVEADGLNGFVYVLDSQQSTVKKTAIQILGMQGQEIALSTPLASKTAVVTTGTAYLSDGVKVKVVE